MRELTKEQEDYLLEEARDISRASECGYCYEYAGETFICPQCGEHICKDCTKKIDDIDICLYCYDEIKANC